MDQSSVREKVRLDKWLWAARFFKTRAIAAQAIAGGKVQLNGVRAKAAKPVHVADQLRVRLGPYDHIVVVRALSERRAAAAVASRLYEETPDSKVERARLATQLQMAPAAFVFEDKGRPTKKDRRDLSSFIDRNQGSEDR